MCYCFGWCSGHDAALHAVLAPLPALHALCATGKTPWTQPELAALPSALSRAQEQLHDGPAFWETTLRSMGVPAGLSTGSIAMKLVILCAAGAKTEPLIPHARAQIDAYLQHIIDALQAKGLLPGDAAAYAAALLARLQHMNDRTLAALDAFFAAGMPPHCVLRLALRHVDCLEVDALNVSFWFSTGHANVLVLHQPTATAVLVEPAGFSSAKNLLHVLKRVLRVPKLKLIHNLHYRRGASAPGTDLHVLQTNDDQLCTVWCAIYGMLVLACGIVTPEDFWALVRHVEAQRTVILRGYLRLAARTLLALSA